MKTIQTKAKSDHLEKYTKVKSPIKAIAELIWNGFDAGAQKVSVSFECNSVGGIDKIFVRDDGKGINYANAESYFENVGGSWKKDTKVQYGRVLHGKYGKGRFLAYSLGRNLDWNTTYERSKGEKYSFSIKGSSQSLEQFKISDEKPKGKNTGTEVTISNLCGKFNYLSEKGAVSDLTALFAVYLMQYRGLVLEYNSSRINPESACKSHEPFVLDNIETDDSVPKSAKMEIYEWSDKTKAMFYLCDSNGFSLYEIPITASNSIANCKNHTIHIKSEYFQELDSNDSLIENNPLIHPFLSAARQEARKYFTRKRMEELSATVERWRQDEIYPYQGQIEQSPVTEQIERKLFDAFAVKIEKSLPFFAKADTKSRKFTFTLLMLALKDNPSALHKIFNEVIGLSKKDQDNFAELLEKTTLESIITTSTIITNRLDFLRGLRNLIYDKDSKEVLLERNQLHKILENEAWIFDEKYLLSASEIDLKKVLEKHLSILGKREDEIDNIVSEAPVLQPDGRRGRVDLMFHRVLKPREDEYDYLVVELKRPTKKIDFDVINQVVGYAEAVARDERFHNLNVQWKFLVVSNEIHDNAKGYTNQSDRAKGLAYTSNNINVWVKSWSQIITEAENRLRFIQEKLSYEASDESAKEYLQKYHAKFIPGAKEIEERMKKLERQAVKKKKSSPKEQANTLTDNASQ